MAHNAPLTSSPALRASASRVQCARPLRARTSLVARAAAAAEAGVKDSVRCYMTAEGNLVCERLEPGNYKLSAGESKTHVEDAALGGAPRCDPLNPSDCITYCYVMEDGSMVCEGLPSGDYQISKAGDEDLPKLVEHAQKLKAGVSSVGSSAAAAAEKPAGEAKGFVDSVVSKVTGVFRST